MKTYSIRCLNDGKWSRPAAVTQEKLADYISKRTDKVQDFQVTYVGTQED